MANAKEKKLIHEVKYKHQFSEFTYIMYYYIVCIVKYTQK